ncbi:hypothetical protein O9929_08470 [Vibrio lentus]|nr:hypothetical protein [Vibrio lentus]
MQSNCKKQTNLRTLSLILVHLNTCVTTTTMTINAVFFDLGAWHSLVARYERHGRLRRATTEEYKLYG